MTEPLFDAGDPLKRCSRCREVKPIAEFHRDRTRKDGIQNYCKSCNIERAKRFYVDNPEKCKERDKRRKPRARDENRMRVLQYLLAHPCIDCGESDPVVLEFDHLRDKVRALSQLAGTAYAWKTIQAEIDKCVVRCANCHRRKTAREMNNFRWRMTRGE